MTVDLDRQLREYGRFMEESQGPLIADDILDRTGDLQVVRSRPIMQTPVRASRRRLTWVVAAAGLIVAMGYLLSPFNDQPEPAVSSSLPTINAAKAYEAVFLRLEVNDDDHAVIVVGVNAAGVERRIPRLPGAWIAYDVLSGEGHLAPLGAVSPGGLLAIPISDGGILMDWVIYDLHRPKEEAIATGVRVPHFEHVPITPYYIPDPRPGAFWGPGERLVIPPPPGSYPSRLTFFDGSDGAITTVEIPQNLTPLPYWTTDRSGVVLGEEYSSRPAWILHVNGSLTEWTTQSTTSGCESHFQSGVEIEVPSQPFFPGMRFKCLAPDESTIVFARGSARINTQGGILAVGDEAWVPVEGTFAGWLRVD